MKELINIPNDQTFKSYFAAELGLTITERINEGHIGLPIFRCTDLGGRKRVVKIGVGPDGKEEIQANMLGYANICRVGGDIIVPDGIRERSTPWGFAIDLPDLGLDFVKSSLSKEVTKENFSVLSQTLLKVTKSTKIKDRESHTSGITEIVSQIKKWSKLLIDNKIVTEDVLFALDKLDPNQISGNFASLMVLDFTPDNVFVNDSQAKFIDPWRQKSYLGTPVPSLSQFITLSENIYKIPGFNNENLNYISLLSKISSEINLGNKQMEDQINLGRALQFSLSAYVRISSAPEISKLYADLGKKSILEIIR